MNSFNSWGSSSIINMYNIPYIYAVPTTVIATKMGTGNFDPVQLGNTAAGYHVYTFDSSGTIEFTSTPSQPITTIIVGGGGGGGNAAYGNGCGGGGGGGVGYGTITLNQTCTLTITIGNGGGSFQDGSNSIIRSLSPDISINAYGGGRGQNLSYGQGGGTKDKIVGNILAGSGGGCCGYNVGGSASMAYGASGSGGLGTSSGCNFTFYYSQGCSLLAGNGHGGGGGGASSLIYDVSAGGFGKSFNILSTTYGPWGGGGGGGGGGHTAFSPGQSGGVGNHGGGNGGTGKNGSGGTPTPGLPGSNNTGGGGGGAGGSSGANINVGGGSGGSGICIIFVPITAVT